MDQYRKDFLLEKIEYNRSVSEKYSIAMDIALKNRYNYPIRTEELNNMCEGMLPVDILIYYGDIDVGCDYFLPDEGHGNKSLTESELEGWCNDTIEDAMEHMDADDFDDWDEEEFAEWMFEEHKDNLNEAFPRDEDFPYSSDYETKALQFAERWGVELSVKHYKYDKYLAEDTQKRHIFKFSIKTANGEYSATFGQSLADGEKTPTTYDILSALTKSDPGTYKDFCAEFGYAGGEDTIKIWKSVCKEWRGVLKLFGPEDSKCFEEFCEIN